VFIDPELTAMRAARFELVGTEITPGVPDTVEGRAAARSSVLRELVRLVYDQVKFSAEGSAAERMHAAALGHPPPGPSRHVD